MQGEIRRLFEQKQNLFITGLAGTGKSYTTRELMSDAQKQGRKLLASAPTGVAALGLGGRTLHSLLGLPPDMQSWEQIQQFASSKYRRNRVGTKNTNEKIAQIA